MTHDQARDAMHPVVRAALARMGQADDLVARCVSDHAFVAMEDDRAPVGVYRDTGRIRVTFRTEGMVARLHLVSQAGWATHSLDLVGAGLPEAAVLSAAGRPLGDVVDIPGGAGIKVLSGRVDGGVATLHLEPPAQEGS